MPCPRGALKSAQDKPNEEWVVECDGHIVASGGLLFHDNPPYGDVFMEVEERYRQQGFGSYLVQELKRSCSVPDKPWTSDFVLRLACL